MTIINIVKTILYNKQFVLPIFGVLFIIFLQFFIYPINYYLETLLNYKINNEYHVSFLLNLKNLFPLIIQSIFYIIFFSYYNLKLLFKTNIKYFILTFFEKIKYHIVVYTSFMVSLITFYLTNFYKHEFINTCYFNYIIIITNISNIISITVCGFIWIILVKIAILSKIK